MHRGIYVRTQHSGARVGISLGRANGRYHEVSLSCQQHSEAVQKDHIEAEKLNPQTTQSRFSISYVNLILIQRDFGPYLPIVVVFSYMFFFCPTGSMWYVGKRKQFFCFCTPNNQRWYVCILLSQRNVVAKVKTHTHTNFLHSHKHSLNFRSPFQT